VDPTHRRIFVKLDLRAVFQNMLDSRPSGEDDMKDGEEKAALVDLPGVSSGRVRTALARLID
jgi:hypothetical protein